MPFRTLGLISVASPQMAALPALACFVVLPEVHPLCFSASASASSSPSLCPHRSCLPRGEDRAGKKAFSVLFLISFLKLPQGWMLQELAQSPSEAGTHPPKTQLLYPIPLLFLQIFLGHLQCAWSCANHICCSVGLEPIPLTLHLFLFLLLLFRPGHCVQLFPFKHFSSLQPELAF